MSSAFNFYILKIINITLQILTKRILTRTMKVFIHFMYVWWFCVVD